MDSRILRDLEEALDNKELINRLNKKENESSREIDHAYLLDLGYTLTSDHWDKLGGFYVGYYGEPNSHDVSRCVRYHKPTGVYTKAYKSVRDHGHTNIRFGDCDVRGSDEYKLFKRNHIIKKVLGQ